MVPSHVWGTFPLLYDVAITTARRGWKLGIAAATYLVRHARARTAGELRRRIAAGDASERAVVLGDITAATVTLGEPGALAARVLLCRARLEFQRDEPIVADDPGVVARLDHVRLAGTDLGL